MGKGHKSSPRKEVPPRRQPAAGGRAWGYWLPLGGLAVLTAVVYSNTLANGFHLDDFYRIVGNLGITQVHPVWRHFLDPGTTSSLKSIQQYRPLLPLTLSLNFAVSGLAPASYHLVNIAAHFMAAAFFYLFFLLLLENWSSDFLPGASARWTAFGAAAIFAVHPISGFPVNYLSSRDLLLMQAFLAATLYSYARMRQHGETAGRWLLTLGLFLLSLLSKTNAAVAVPVVFLFETLVAGESPLSRKPWLRTLPFALVVVLLLAFTRIVLGFSDLEQALAEGNGFLYPLTQIKLHLFHYLRNFLWPFEIRGMPYVQRVISPLDPRMLAALAFIVATLWAAWLARRRAPIIAFAILAYWASILPESSFLPLHHWAADYRVYPGLPFLTLVVCMLMFKYLPPRAAPWLLAGLLLYFGGSAYVMNRHYRTELSFWGQSVRYGGDEVATMNYAMCLRGRDDAAAKQYLEKALQINPGYYLGYINLGLLYLDQGDKEKGLALVQQGVSYSPRSVLDRSLYWQGVAFEKAGDLQKAQDAIALALAYNANNLDYLYEAAFIAQARGNYMEALGYLELIHQREPNIKISRFVAGWCQQAMGRPDRAEAEYRLAIRYRPDYAQSYANLAYALKALGRTKEACGYFEKFLAREPGNRGVRAALEACRKSESN